MGEEVIDPGLETEYELNEELCYCSGVKDSNMLQCILCRRMFHLGCLKSGKPSTLVGDVFFTLTCASCSSDGSETCTRQNVSWLQAVYLSLYNLYSTSTGRKGYFRWREDICLFIDRHWMVLFPKKKKTTTWFSTVAGILSSGCPQYFKSGQKEFNKETGWWALQENVAPVIKFSEAESSGYKRKRKRGCISPTESKAKTSNTLSKDQSSTEVQTSETHNKENALQPALPPDSDKCDDPIAQLLTREDMHELAESISGFDALSNFFSASCEDVDSTFSFTGGEERTESEVCVESETGPEDTVSLASTITSDTDLIHTKVKSKPIKTTLNLTQTSLVLASEEKEKDVLVKLNCCPKSVNHDPVARRFRRKLILRQLKRAKGLQLFDLDKNVSKAVTTTLRYQQTADGAVPIENRNVSSEIADETREKPLQQGFSSTTTGTAENILDRYLASPRMLPSSRPRTCSFLTRLVGGDSQTLYRPITSPYTSRILKPFIRRDYESRPLKLQVLQEVVARYHRRNGDPRWTPPSVAPIDYCYVQPHHIPSVNAMCREFFWPGIDLSECLQYPDFSCVVLYKKFVIGFAFMVPDVKYNEAYISFVLVHPEWRRGGIGTYMIYHLIQTCMGKDVTLHVSVTNPAMLLYQKFGFKPEEFILHFYSRYLPEDSPQCRHAFFLRLRR